MTSSTFHMVEFLGFYLPPLVLWAIAAVIPFVILRGLLERFGFYRFVWHRSLFNLALYVVLVGGVVFFGKLPYWIRMATSEMDSFRGSDKA